MIAYLISVLIIYIIINIILWDNSESPSDLARKFLIIAGICLVWPITLCVCLISKLVDVHVDARRINLNLWRT